jgi:trimeric autotransporter adhesin
MKKILRFISPLFLALPLQVFAQPSVLGTQLVNGGYTTYNLNTVGGFRQVRLQAAADAPASTLNWEFVTGTAATPNYTINWRPYTAGLTLAGYNTFIAPVGGTASALYNTGTGGQSGLLPAVTNTNYYTFNVTSNAAANNNMAVMETTYNPETITAVSQSPLATYVVNTSPVTVTVTTSAAPNANVYVRYTTNGWTSSSLVQLSFTGATGTAVIPAQPAGTTVQYYIYNSPKTAAAITTDVTNFGQVAHDMATLNLNNNSGSNYSYTVLSAAVTVTSTGLPANDASYATLKDAFDRINAGIHTASVAITVIGNTTETAAAVLNASGTGSASYTAISIQPSGARTVSGNLSGVALVDLNGADNVNINGLNSGGNSLTFTNTSTGGAGTATLRLYNAATGNTIQNCTIEGSGTISSTATLLLGTGTNTATITANTIKAAGSNLPTVGVLSSGSNNNIVFTNNNVQDYFNAAAAAFGLNITSGSAWTITGNKFYQTGARTITTGATHTAISITSAGNAFDISDNVIGYASSSKSGTATYSGSVAVRLVGIELSAGTTTASSIQNNEIAGFALSTTSNASTFNGIFTGIYVNAGWVNIGTVTGNKIGVLSTGSIAVTVATNNGGAVNGIFVSTSSTCAIQNNTITAITIAGTTAGIGNTFNGISTQGTGNYTISGNTIGHASTANAVTVGNSGTTATCTINGIANTSTGVVNIGATNIIANLALTTNASNSGAINGINNNAAAGGTATITGNTIYALSANGNTATISGVTVASGGTTTNIAKNKIYSLSNNTGTGAIINGINVPATVGTTVTISNNIIGELSATAITNGTAPTSIQGINLNTTGTFTVNVYYNSVYLTGTATGTTAFGSAALYANTAPTIF